MKIILLALVAVVCGTMPLLARSMALSKPSFTAPHGCPTQVVNQVSAALSRLDCKFVGGQLASRSTHLRYDGDTKALNGMLSDLAKCPGVALTLQFTNNFVEPGDWSVGSVARYQGTFAFSVLANLKSERIKVGELRFPEVKGPSLKPAAAAPASTAPKPDAPVASLRTDVRPVLTQLSNDQYSAIAVQSEKEVNFVLVYAGSISSGVTDSSSEADGKWGFEGSVHLVAREKTKPAGKNVDQRVVTLKYASDAATKLFLDGKAYDLAAPPRMTPMGAFEAAPGRIFLLRDKGEPFQTQRTLALRNEKDLATIGQFAVKDHVTARVLAESRRVQQMEGWVLALDHQVPLRRSGGHRTARLRIFPDGRVLSLPDGRTLRELKISAEELSDLLRWLAEDQKVSALKPQAAPPDDPKLEIHQQFDTWVGGVSFLQFKYNGQLHGMTIGSHLRKSGTGTDLANPAAAVFKPIYERLIKIQ
jgi:hypothetical protein